MVALATDMGRRGVFIRTVPRAALPADRECAGMPTMWRYTCSALICFSSSPFFLSASFFLWQIIAMTKTMIATQKTMMTTLIKMHAEKRWQ